MSFSHLIGVAVALALAGCTSLHYPVNQRLAKFDRTYGYRFDNVVQQPADLEAKDQKLALMKRQFARLQEQLDNTTIKSPAEWLVVYAQNCDSSAPI